MSCLAIILATIAVLYLAADLGAWFALRKLERLIGQW